MSTGPQELSLPPANTQATLLLIDDEPIILDVLQEVLAPTGHRMVTASNGREALDIMAQDPPDLILLDLMMPELDGFEVCRRIKSSAEWWTIPIIVFTALDQPEDYARAIDCGADDFMSKPLNDTILLARVRGYLRAKQSMEALRQREAYTRMIIDAALDAIVTIDAMGLITTWNPQAEAMFGWSSQEVVGQLLSGFIIPPRFRPAHEMALQRFHDTGESSILNTRIETTARHRDGREFPVEVAITSVQVGNSYLFTAFIRDITARQEAERALHQAKEAAETANAAKTEFLANMSHELRTPMHGILSFASLGLDQVATISPEKVDRYFQRIFDSGQTLLALLNNLLDLAKLEASELTLTLASANLNALVVDVITELNAWAVERQLILNWCPSPVLTEACLDADKIKQVIRNLLSNAIKFSPPSGTITLTTRSGPTAVQFIISDQGPGIPDAEREAVFDKFVQSSTTKTIAGGTGLGLSICREIITLHNGRIWLADNPGGGTHFGFELPHSPQNI